MPGYVYLILFCGWLAWLFPFFFLANRSQKAQHVDPRARWGVVLQMIAYALLWQGHFWLFRPPTWRIALGVSFLIAASLLSWTSVRALGRQWRVDAGLNSDHQLVRSGPYAIVRHPIYTSMLCILLGTGLLVTSWLLFGIALIVFLAGAGIRMQVENKLLADRFGSEFASYKRSVPAVIPGLPKRFLQSR
jgi:protein-S-isoprenylcysteine O-methyltransferase Ste14